MNCIKSRKYINLIKEYNSFMDIKEFIVKMNYDIKNNILVTDYIYNFQYDAPLYINEYLLYEFPNIKCKIYLRNEYINVLNEYDNILIKELPNNEKFMVVDIYEFKKFIIIENNKNNLLKTNYIDLERILNDYQYYRFIYEKLRKIIIKKKFECQKHDRENKIFTRQYL